jgi:type III secretory pathway component EscT
LDPLAAALLFFKPRLGVVATIAIMLADVAHNSWAFMSGRGDVVALVLQATFLGFVLGTSPSVWAAAAWGIRRKG